MRVHWEDKKTGRRGFVDVALDLRRPLKDYGEIPGASGRHAPDWIEAEQRAFRARSRVTFVNTTGLKASKASYGRFVPRDRWGLAIAEPRGFDHTSVWYCSTTKRYAVTTEPYHDDFERVEESCKQLGWRCHTFPEGVGLWNPPDTRLILISPGKHGVELESLIPKLKRRLPRRYVDGDWLRCDMGGFTRVIRRQSNPSVYSIRKMRGTPGWFVVDDQTRHVAGPLTHLTAAKVAMLMVTAANRTSN